MDTKWNGTDNIPAEYFVCPRRRGRVLRALAGAAAFFLGVSLILGSLGAMAGRIMWQRDPNQWWKTQDWQDTDAFRQEVSSYLRQFLSLGAGARLTWYDSQRGAYYSSSIGVTEGIAVEPAELWQQEMQDYGYAVTYGGDGVITYRPVEKAEDLDLGFREDKNVLYDIQNTKDEKRAYSNCEEDIFSSRNAPGYNFYLLFQDGRARIWKDGEELDVYGGGLYQEDSQWFLPGYENFPAGDQLSGVTVRMAVREEPVQYFQISSDYDGYDYSGSSAMYYVRQSLLRTRDFYRTQAALLGAGLALAALWFLLRRDARLAAEKIASWTVHVWTEVRVLAAAALIVWMILGSDWESFYWQWRELWWEWSESNQLWTGQLVYGAASFLLSAFPALLALIWLIWLIRNDHRYNPKEARKSLLGPLFRALRARDLKRPVEKRLSRRAALSALAMTLLGAETLHFLIVFTVSFNLSPYVICFLWTAFLLPLLLAVWAAIALSRRERALARDLGLLADQVEAVRSGDLSTPLTLPKDADLRQTAEALNDIQAGMKAALAEQTRSERMKVELVSNVSHDLKTPLTSILSYAELLRQEDLPPAAADYARIIDEKAQRLKSMVQDVFDVSKAAADQLPLQIERLDLAKLLRQTLADMADPIEKSALAFKVELPADPVMISADGRRLYRVFQNLIQNALQYALAGSRVYLALKTAERPPEAGTAQVTIRNTSREELPVDVDFTARFVRGDESRTDGGSGLGLSIAKSFTEACGGSFRVEVMADLFTAEVTFPLA